MENNNGNVLIKGTELTEPQKNNEIGFKFGKYCNKFDHIWRNLPSGCKICRICGFVEG